METKTRHIVGATLAPKKSGFLSQLVVVISLWFLAISTGVAQEFANVEYLCCDWGPAMTWSGKTNEPPKFSDTEDEIYFLKQVGSFTKGPLGTQNHGLSIYLCKMKPDGSAKTEIKELWKNPNYPIDTQGQSTWMDVNRKTRKITLSVLFAGTDVMGLWTMNLDGTEFRQIIRPEWGEKLTGIDHPSWAPDGRWIVFEHRMRGMNPERFNIALCDANGGQLKQLFEATEKIEYRQPSVSPDGKQIAFARYPNGYPGGRQLWLANIDGRDAHPLPNPNDKRNTHGGDYPVLSPDGTKIWAMSVGIVDAVTGQKLLDRRPMVQGRQGTCGCSHWGKSGFIGFTVGGIRFTDPELQESKRLGPSHVAKCSGPKEICKW